VDFRAFHRRDRLHDEVGVLTVFRHAFPQWAHAIIGGDIAHYFKCVDAFGVSESICGRVEKNWQQILPAGTRQHCKDCERRLTKSVRRQEAMK
jgi:hypothetical protein